MINKQKKQKMIKSNPAEIKVTKKRILLVDDEETLRLSIKQVLSEDGYEVVTAKNGTEALELVRAEGFDLVITDLRMPGLSGLQLVSEIKKTDSLTKIIVISAYGTMETVVEAMRLGVNDFVAKPFKVKSMKEIVTRVLDGSKKKSAIDPSHLYPIEGRGGTANAGEVGRETKSAAATDSILIQPDLPYCMDQSQEGSSDSGAFFDAVNIGERKFALIFGSAPSNYDGDASLLGTMVKAVFRTVIASGESDNYNHPQRVVDKINKYLCLNTKHRIPVSLFCAMIDNDKGVIEYVNQGRKLFCCLLQSASGGSKIVELESSPYPLNLFPDIYIEENTSLPASGGLILSSNSSLAAVPISKETVQPFAKSWEGCTGKETARKIRKSLSSAIMADKLDNDWAVVLVDLNWKRSWQSASGGHGIEPRQEKIIIPASTNDLRGIVSQIENILKGFSLTPQKEHGIITAINEAIINARLFAYKKVPRRNGKVKAAGDIAVQFMLMGNELIVEVFDSGCGFSVQSYRKPDFTDYQSVTSESGRGIFLIQKLMDRVMIQSSDNIGTRVYMAKEVKSNGC